MFLLQKINSVFEDFAPHIVTVIENVVCPYQHRPEMSKSLCKGEFEKVHWLPPLSQAGLHLLSLTEDMSIQRQETEYLKYTGRSVTDWSENIFFMSPMVSASDKEYSQ